GTFTNTVSGKSNDASAPSDPLAHRTFSKPSGNCTPDPNISSGNPTLSPGAYCGLTISDNGGTVTLNSGIYYIEGGNFSVSNGTVVSAGNGVTIVMTSTNAAPNTFGTVNISGQATLNLTALPTGPTAGIVFFGDPANTTNQSETFSGQGTNLLTGAIYFPNQTVAL